MYPIFRRSVHPPFGTIELLQSWRSFCHRIVLNKIAAEMPKPLVLNRSIRRGTEYCLLRVLLQGRWVKQSRRLAGT
jgi:hypothetical protein